MFPKKGMADTVLTGCHNSMPMWIREESEPYITVLWEGQSIDSIYSGSQSWTIEHGSKLIGGSRKKSEVPPRSDHFRSLL